MSNLVQVFGFKLEPMTQCLKIVTYFKSSRMLQLNLTLNYTHSDYYFKTINGVEIIFILEGTKLFLCCSKVLKNWYWWTKIWRNTEIYCTNIYIFYWTNWYSMDKKTKLDTKSASIYYKNSCFYLFIHFFPG